MGRAIGKDFMGGQVANGAVTGQDIVQELMFLSGMAEFLGETGLAEDIAFVADRFRLEQKYQTWGNEASNDD
jgi:hypothetical protein